MEVNIGAVVVEILEEQNNVMENYLSTFKFQSEIKQIILNHVIFMI